MTEANVIKLEGKSNRTASCNCSQLQIKTRGEPVRISMCHCYACQKRTGSVFGVQARFPKDLTEATGSSTEYIRVAADGDRIFNHFCPQCGSVVYYWMESQPELIGVPVGGFADRTFPAPKVSIFEVCMHPWVKVPESVTDRQT